MSTGERDPLPDFDFNRELLASEVIAFRDEVLWPVVDIEFKGDFVADSLPGEDVIFGRTVIDPDEPQSGESSIKIYARCVPRDELEDDVERACFVEVIVKEKQPGHTRDLIEYIARQYHERGREFHIPSDIEELSSAWLVSRYYFDTSAEDPLDVEKQTQLIANDGEVIWDIESQILLQQDDEVGLSDDEAAVFDELLDNLNTRPVLTLEDIFKMQTYFIRLGLLSLESSDEDLGGGDLI